MRVHGLPARSTRAPKPHRKVQKWKWTMSQSLLHQELETHTPAHESAASPAFPFSANHVAYGTVALGAGLVLTLLGSPLLFSIGLGIVVTVLGLVASWTAVAKIR